MGQSGASGGGGGGGGVGIGGYSGSRGSGVDGGSAKRGGGRGSGPGAGRAGAENAADPARKVLTSLKPAYLQRQFIGPLASGIVRDIILLSIDLSRGGKWRSICDRLSLDYDASLQEVRDAIFARNAENEHDQRVIGSSRVALIRLFEELTKFEDDLLAGRRRGESWMANVDPVVLEDALPKFLAFLIQNVLMREEDQALPAPDLTALGTISRSRADKLVTSLRNRYKASGDAGDARVLMRAAANEDEKTWFLAALRA